MVMIKKYICVLIAMIIFSVPVFANEIGYDELMGPSYIDETTRMASPGRVIITDFYIMGGGLIPGETSTAVFLLQNKGQNSYVNGVLLTGWIDSAAPVEFADTNQVYAGRMEPGAEVTITFEYYTRKVDLTAFRGVYAGFAISYGDEATNSVLTNNVSFSLPVLSTSRVMIDEEDMKWAVPHTSNIDEFLSSGIMQAVYAGVFVLCTIWIILIFLFKLDILKRRF